ncbi:MAG: ribose-phosphate pyrophosphokinase [Lachnospiraceae bacterium]|nr:ribose-phosphate pyrophosphokinase [Lachnospiraceae bacterium]
MAFDANKQQLRPAFDTIPEGRLAIIPMSSTREIGKKVNDFLVEWRKERVVQGIISPSNGYVRDSFLLEASTPRFGSGEAKGTIKESVRGYDIYLLVDVLNYSLTYRIGGYENVMSPDDHFQDLKRVISACGRKAHRINVIMPYLYEGRQILPGGRESADCASALQELIDLGVENIITFDAHDSRVQNAIPFENFETVSPSYQFLKNVLRCAPDLELDSDHMMIISPDEGGMSRAIYMANVLGIDMGMFYKRRDYTTLVSGRNPVLAHEFLGSEVSGKDIIILDDMISSGDKVIETCKLLKKKKAKRIFICATFGVMTGGLVPFDNAYKHGWFDKLITTNLIYQPEELLTREYYKSCDMSKFLALIIDTLNHDCSISSLLDPVDRIHKVMAKYRDGQPV